MVKAVCATSNAPRTRKVERPADWPRPPSRNIAFGAAWPAPKWAANVSNTAMTMASNAEVNAIDGVTAISAARGSVRPPSPTNTRTVAVAISTPPIQATPANMRLPASSWRNSRPRPAPSAERNACSRRRPIAIDNNRFIALLTAITNKNTTPTINTCKAVRTGAAIA